MCGDACVTEDASPLPGLRQTDLNVWDYRPIYLQYKVLHAEHLQCVSAGA